MDRCIQIALHAARLAIDPADWRRERQLTRNVALLLAIPDAGAGDELDALVARIQAMMSRPPPDRETQAPEADIRPSRR